MTFTIVVQPRTAKARLVLGGRTYHGTALRLRTPRSAEPTKLRVSAPGHRTKELLLVPSADARVRVKLERVGRRPRARSRRKTKKRPRAALLELTD